MNTPTPLFVTAFAQPLASRLTPEAALAKAEIVIAALGQDIDTRLVCQAPIDGFKLITGGGVAARFLVQWPDGALAYAYLPAGGQVLEGMREALISAYSRGRDRLEQIYLELDAPQGLA